MKPSFFLSALFAAALIGLSSLADGTAAYEISVADYTVKTEMIISNNVRLAVSTPYYGTSAFPGDVNPPAYWFDASDTTGWDFCEVDGVVSVSNIPSKAGSTLAGRRWLTIESIRATTPVSGDGDEWYGWWANDKADCTVLYRPVAPAFKTDDAGVKGGKCVDFGALSSRRALMFNSYVDEGCTVASNSLKGIGSVVAVYNSENSGGWFMGGGGNGSFIRWHRETSDVDSSSDTVRWTNPMFQANASASARQGVVRHDGFASNPQNSGFNRSWEIITLNPSEANLIATGPGVGDGRGYGVKRSGGMRIAELMVFDRVLTDAECEKIEAHLKKKWFGREPGAGRNGDARVGSVAFASGKSVFTSAGTQHAAAAVGAGETLTIDRLTGGRGYDARFVKTGAGKLRLADAAEYAAPIEVQEGSLEYPSLRPIPAADRLPRDCFAHFDPSDDEKLMTYEEGGEEWFNGTPNLESTTIGGKPFFLSCNSTRRCWVRRDEPAKGLNLIDCGVYSTYNGRYLRFATGETRETQHGGTEVSVKGVQTYIAVYDARCNGGHFGNTAELQRSSVTDSYWSWMSNGILAPADIGTKDHLMADEASKVYINGVRMNPKGQLETSGIQIVAIQTTGATISRIGVTAGNNQMGGLRLGELFLYRRLLSEEELRDVSAYLLKKWLGRVQVGYTDGTAKTAVDVEQLKVSGTAKLEVGAGRTVKVASANVADGALEKTGEGRLEVGSVSGISSYKVTGGELAFTQPRDADETCQLAADPICHFDSDDTSRMLVMNDSESGNADSCAIWYDQSLKHALSAYSSARRPRIKTDSVSGLRYLDFDYYSASYPCCLMFNRPLANVRTYFVIWRPKTHVEKQYVQLFGSVGSSQKHVDPIYDCIDNLRNETWNSTAKAYPLFRNTSTSPFAQSSKIYVNGVASSGSYIPVTNAFQLIEVEGKDAAGCISALSWDRGNRPGGAEWGEFVCYNRVLTEREKIATRNYLMKRWFGAEPKALPAKTAVRNDVGTLEVAEGAAAELTNPTSVETVKGTGAVKTEEGAILQSLNGFTGTVEVAGGVCQLPHRTIAVAPKLHTDGVIAHFDMSDATTLTVDGDLLKEWRSKVGDWKAVGAAKYLTGLTQNWPKYRAGSLNGMDALELESGVNRCMLFEDGSGLTNSITGIRSVVWVIGTKNNRAGGFLLGGGDRTPGTGEKKRCYAWHRGGSGGSGSDAAQPIASSSGQSEIMYGTWQKNGEGIEATKVGLETNDWQTVGFRSQNGVEVAASGFAFDGRFLEGQRAYDGRCGNQWLAEVVLYSRALTDLELKEVQSYLQLKWGLADEAHAYSVKVADGGAVDLRGYTHTFASISGEGAVRNGFVNVATLVADGAATAWPTLENCVIADGQTVELRNVPADPIGKSVKILSADAFDGVENLRSAVFTGDVPDPNSVRTRLRVVGDDLVVTFKTMGLLLLVR